MNASNFKDFEGHRSVPGAVDLVDGTQSLLAAGGTAPVLAVIVVALVLVYAVATIFARHG